MANPTVEAIEEQTEELTLKLNQLHDDLLQLKYELVKLRHAIVWKGQVGNELLNEDS